MNISRLHSDYSERASDVVQLSASNLFVTNAIRNLIQTVFVELATSFVVTISTRYSQTHYWYRDMMEKLFFTWGFSAVQLIIVNEKQPIHVPGKRYCNLLLIDSFQALLATDIASHNSNFDTSEYYFIFLQTEDILVTEEMDLIFDYCLLNYWIHCNVMIQTTNVEVLVYTYFPFNEQNCRSTIPVLVNQFDGRQWKHAPMFPDKLQNMNQCALKIISWNTPPFVYITEKLDGSIGYRGFEMSMMRTLGAHMNFTLDLISLKDPNSIEYEVSNKNSNGPLEMLAKREANLSLGYFRKTTQQDRLATSTFTHYYSTLVAVILRSNQKYTSLEVLSFPFHLDIWLIILICMIGIICLIKTIRIYLLPHFTIKIIYNISLPIVRIFIGIPLVKEPIPHSYRLFVTTLLLATFVLRCVYQSLLFHLIRTDLYRETPRTFDALIQAKYKAIATANTILVLRDIPQVAQNHLKYEAINVTHDLEVFDALECSYEGNYFAAIAKEVIGRFGPDKSLEVDFDVIPEYIKKQQLTIYMPKHSYLVEKFNEQILRFQSNGLLEAWDRWHLNSNMEGFKKIPNTEMLMGQRELIGIYIITGSLLLCALIIFLLELLSLKVNFLQKFVDV